MVRSDKSDSADYIGNMLVSFTKRFDSDTLTLSMIYQIYQRKSPRYQTMLQFNNKFFDGTECAYIFQRFIT